MRRAWDSQAENWIRWARSGVDQAFFGFNAARFLDLVPQPGRLTLDLGAGEGRVGRLLRERGHTVVEVEQSPRLAGASAELTPGAGVIGDVSQVPLRSGVADIAAAFMSFQDVDDFQSAIKEAARVLEPGGRFVMAIVHPINSAGEFVKAADGEAEVDRQFVMYPWSYYDHRHYVDDIDRDGVVMRFESEHRPIESYSHALEDAGFVIEALREVGDPDPTNKWSRMPLFLDIRARKISNSS